MKIYISGKITGLPIEEAKEKFNKAKIELENWGYDPVSPIENNCKSNDWCEQMMCCLPLLLGCKGIYLLSDWHMSEGSKIEYTFAVNAGMYIIEEDRQKKTYKLS